MVTGIPRASVSQRTQWGTETTPNVGGSANKKPPTASLGLGPAGDGANMQRPGGGKYVGSAQAKDGWAEGDVKDILDFNTMPYWGVTNIGYTAPGVAVDGAYTWHHTPDPDAPETMKTLIAQEGVAGAVETYRNILLPDLGLAIGRNDLTVSGKAVGKKTAFGTSLTAATRIPKAPMHGLNGGFWMADNFADTDMLAVSPPATRMDPYGFDAKWGNNGRFGMFFPVDDSVSSFGGLLEQEADAPFTIMQAFDVNSTAIRGPFNMEAYDEGDIIYLAYWNHGPLIGVTAHYEFLLRMCLQIVAPPKKGNVGPLKVYEWTCQQVVDDVAGIPFKMTERNTLASI